MSPKSLGRLALLLGALVLATIAAALWSRPRRAPTLLAEGLAKTVGVIELQGPEGALELKRDKGAWAATAPGAYPADGKSIEELLGKLPQASLAGPLTEDPQRYSMFGFSASSPTRVRLEAAGQAPVLDFYVGKDGPDYPSAFIRLAAQTGVLEASGMSASDWTRSPGEWLDKTITAGPADAVSRVSVRGKKGSWELRQSSGGWTVGGKRVPAEQAERLVRQAREAAGGLQADRVLFAAGAPKDTGLDKPELRVEVQTARGAASFAVGKQDDRGRRYVSKAGEVRVLFLVSDWKLDALRKSASDFFKK